MKGKPSDALSLGVRTCTYPSREVPTVPPYLSSCVCCPSFLPNSGLQQKTALQACAASGTEPERIALNIQLPCFSILNGGRMTCRGADPNPTLGSRNLFVISSLNTPDVQTDPSRAQIAALHAIPTLCEARKIRWVLWLSVTLQESIDGET